MGLVAQAGGLGWRWMKVLMKPLNACELPEKGVKSKGNETNTEDPQVLRIKEERRNAKKLQRNIQGECWKTRTVFLLAWRPQCETATGVHVYCEHVMHEIYSPYYP